MFEIHDFTFLLFRKELDREAFDAGWPGFFKEYIEEDAGLYGQVYEPIFHKLREIHYNSDLPVDFPTGNKSFLYTLMLIGIAILLLAGINYTNMTTAKALTRIREAGIRKIVGAGKASLISCFLFESFIFCLISLILALATVEFILEFTSFNTLIGTEMELQLLKKPELLLLIFGVTILFSLLSSLHPAILISRHSPSETISDQFNLGPKGMVIRRILVVFQLFIGTVAIIFTLFSRSQLRFLNKSDLGFNKENILMIPVRDSAMEASMPYLLDEMGTMPGIVSATTTWSYPGFPYGGLYTLEGKEGMEEHNIPVFFVNFGFLETMGLELIRGRDLNRQFGTDSAGAVLINETLARFMDWEEPLGKKINQFTQLQAKVVGVVKDFNFHSLHQYIDPLVIRLVSDYTGHLVVRFEGNSSSDILDYLKKQFAETVPHRPFEYFFLDDWFNQKYQGDKLQLQLFTLFAMVCIIIASLGILGLVSYSVERRTREIGLRKVNGAHSGSIIRLVFTRFLILNLVAISAAIPVAILIFRFWLREFAYRVSIRIWPILLGVLLVLIIAQLTVYLRVQSAARMNPVDSIRYE